MRHLLLLCICLDCWTSVGYGQVKKNKKRKPHQTEAMRQLEQPINISAGEFRTLMNTYFVFVSGTIELAADSIMKLSDKRTVDYEAMLWKMYSIPAVQRAIFVSDPMLALVDAIAFVYQMDDYYKGGIGAQAFGPYQHVAHWATGLMKAEAIKLAGSLSENRDLSKGIALLENYADENPIQSPYFLRGSTRDLLTNFMAVEKIGFKALALDAAASITEINNRITIYTEMLPKQARWQLEYLIMAKEDEYAVHGRLDTINRQIEQALVQLDDLQYLIDTQRVLVFDGIRTERQAITGLVERERALVMGQLHAERKAVTDVLQDESQAFSGQIDSLVAASIEQGFDRADATVAGLTRRLFGVAGILGLSLILAALILRVRRSA